MAFPTTNILDNFDRANEGPPPSASWIVSQGTGLKVAGSVAVPNVLTVEQGSTWNSSFGAHQEVFCKIASSKPADGTGTFLYVRLATNNDYLSNHYEVDAVSVAGANNDKLQIFKRFAAVFTQLGSDISLGVDLSVGDQIGLAVSVSTITVYLNGVLKDTQIDTDVPGAGYIGIDMDANNNGATDDFGGGLTVATATLMGAMAGFHPITGLK